MSAKSKNSTSKAIHGSTANGMWIALGALAVVIVVAVAGFVVAQRMGVFDKEAVAVSFADTKDDQISINDKGAITVGNPDAPHVDLYEDFMCPVCGQFEQQSGERIVDEVKAGNMQVTFHFLNFLDRSSGSGEYSTRAIAAIQCIATMESLENFLAAHSAFFTNQPQEGGGDLSAAELAGLARDAGVGDEAASCVEGVNGENGDNMDKARETASNSQATMSENGLELATPTVAQGDKELQWSDPTWIDTVLTAA